MMSKLTSANKRLLSDSPAGLPQMAQSVSTFLQNMTIAIVTKENVGGFVQEVERFRKTMGCKQPASAEQISIRPEGERSWKWFTFHCLPDLVLTTDDRVTISGVRYRVMEKSDFSEYGYLEYLVAEDFQT